MIRGTQRAAGVESKAELLALLAEDPALATPRLARELWRRVVDLHRADARAARELADCAWLVAERAGDQRSRALAHRAKALAALAAGHQREALEHYESAERLHRDLGEDVERARVLRSMIDPLMHLGRYDEALAAGDESGRILRAHGEQVLAAQVDANVGNVHHRLGRDAESLDAYGRALSAFRDAGDLDAAAVVEFNRANVFLERSELAEAQRGYRRALRHYRSRGERLRESQCRYQLAYLAFLAGRYSEALRGLEAVRTVERELGDERHAALCTLDESELLLSLNAWEEARDRAAQARGELADLGLAQESLRAALFLGLSAFHLKRWGEAARLLAEARQGFRDEGNEVLTALAILYEAELALRRGQPRAALAAAYTAVRAFEARGLAAKEGYARTVAGRALALLGRDGFARRQAEAALVRLGRVPSAGIRWRAHALLADLAADPEEKARLLETAIDEAELLRARIVPDELRASYQRDKVALYEALALGVLTGREQGKADARAAFETLESARARVLTDQLARPAAPDFSTEAADAGTALRAAVEELNHLYRRLNEAERDDASRAIAEPIRAAVATREGELAALHRNAQLRAGSARAPGSRAPADTRAVARALDPGEVLVAYAYLAGDLHAFVVDGSGVRWTGAMANRADVEAALAQWRFQAGKTALGREYMNAHAAPLRAAALHALGRLHDLVWAPLAPYMGDPTAIVVEPAGPLFYVPFHALWDGDRHLVERYGISTVPSAGALIAGGRRAGAPDSRTRALVLGYEVEGLPGITREVEAVRARLPQATVLVGRKATRAALRRLSGDVSILHLAAHAVYRDDNPLLSSIELADGRLTFYDLFDLRLKAAVVVLSGCQTAGSRVMEGEEVMGLARGFQQAGARSLVASLWPVEDAAAADVMSRFYAAIASGGGPEDALRLAMREGIETGRLPHEWAPFYLSGRSEREGRPS
ncbi:MAG TPA: CHAT domain-containing protein [Gemmatimonadota bacterium]|nr:CHAT domain-containing protein [Gemmatimonadota bacterium]